MKCIWRNVWFFGVVLALACGIVSAQNLNTPIPLAKGQLIAFLGDSITQQNLYSRYVELMLNEQFPDLDLHFVNVGWSGRHSAHLMDDAVLERDLVRLKPDMVLILFGMNDGWYRNPPVLQAVAAYHDNMDNLVSKIMRALPNTRIVLLTPTICDPSISNYLKGYNGTLGDMAQYVSDLAARRNLPLIDLHKPMLRVDAAAKAADQSFTMIPDGVHPNPSGHWLLATLIDGAFYQGAPLRARVEIDAQTGTVVSETQAVVSDFHTQKGAYTFTQTLPRALIVPPIEARAAVNFAPVQAARDQATLIVDNLRPDTTYGVYINNHLFGRFTAAELTAGIDWTLPKQDDPLTERVLGLAMTKFQYRWAAWRNPGTGLAEISPDVANSDEWKAFDTALNGLVRQADTEEHRLIADAKEYTWSIVPETAIDLPKWEVTGPFNYQSFNVSYPPEIGTADLDWTTMGAVNGFLDFSPAFGQFRNSLVCARVRLYVPHETRLALSAGSDASIKIWVNGTLCIARDTFRTAQPGQDSGVATLEPGWNTILARENRGNYGWGLYIQAYLSDLTPDEMKLVRTNPM
ncbi:MAG TPA: SGNH/GDSL hydrolase family protein [Armatimonadota bacterium]|nr:SGNH/GDSL hydrolase family protein [Armatimonadota bacterium]